MRKFALMLVVGILAVSSAVLAHDPPGETTIAVKFPAGLEPTIDGDCSDWGAVPGDQYWTFSDAFYPHGDRHPSEGLGRGDMDASNFSVTARFGWSETANNLYYCDTVFDDKHVIDRPDSYDWYADDSQEYFLSVPHLSEDEVRASNSDENYAVYVGYNYAVPKAASGDFWMVIGICIGCDWILGDVPNPLHHLSWSYDGAEYGESTYTYEHRMSPFVGRELGLGEDITFDDMDYTTLEDGQTVHFTRFLNDDDADREDGRGGSWATGSPGGPGGTWLGHLDHLLEPANPNINWPDAPTSVESASWGQIKAQY